MREATSPLLLAAVVLNGLLLAFVLARAGRRTPALRWLAALVAVLAIRIVPYPLGFTGAYDRWKWLTFLPVDLTLALGPLLWGYVHLLSRGAPPARLRWHFLPAALQFGYQLVAFCIPQPLKGHYYQRVHVPIVEPIGLVLVLAALVVYTVASWRLFSTWQRWMDDHLSNREAYRLGVVKFVLTALSVVTVAGLFGALRHLVVAPLTYGERAPTMLGFGILVYGLGLGGLWQRGQHYPTITDDAAPMAGEGEQEVAVQDVAAYEATVRSDPTVRSSEDDGPRRGRPAVDYAELARTWGELTRSHQWFRDPELTLATLAVRLNASPRTVSRGLREGMGVSFHAFVNTMRVEEVTVRLADPAERRSVLSIALEAGFASKASFNRAFKEVTGTTPGAMRRVHESD